MDIALMDLGSDARARSGALLHAHEGTPPIRSARWLVEEMLDVHFAAHLKRVRCTRGELAIALAARSDQGANNVAAALHGWVSPEQASELQWHIESGRIVLWLQPSTAEDFDIVCARLVRASPHLVGICNVDLDPRQQA